MTGGIVSGIILIIMLIYGTIKLIQLESRHNPNVTEHIEKANFDYSE